MLFELCFFEPCKIAVNVKKSRPHCNMKTVQDILLKLHTNIKHQKTTYRVSGDGAWQLPVPERPTTLEYGRAEACCACSRCVTGGLF